MRTKKTVDGWDYEYYYSDGLLVRQTYSVHGATDYIDFLYDESGTPYSFIYNGTQYYYIKNLQNDVIAIANTSGSIVVNYTYDAWGNILGITGSMASTVGAANPIRYRSYYYDTDTGFYYLQTRYYDPAIRRFINADGYLNANGDILGFNMYAYCGNNPVNYVDYTGEIAILTCVLIGAGIGAVLGGTIGAVSSYKKTGRVSIKATLGGVFIGGIVGAIAGYGVGCLIGAAGAPIAGSGGKALLKTIQQTKISNTKLANWIKECFRAQGKIGNGGLSDAIRYEKIYNKLVGGKSHIQKGLERVAGLKKIIEKGGLSLAEMELAKILLEDLLNALNGK